MNTIREESSVCAGDHIAFFLPLLSGGGAERVMLNLAAGFVEKGVKVDFVLAKAAGPYLDQLPKEARLVDLDSSGVLTSLPGLIRYLRKERPVALISALDHANVVAIWAKLLARAGTRSVVTLHNTISEKRKLASKVSKASIVPFLIRLFFPLADSIIAVSNGVAEDYAQVAGLDSGKIQVIYNPVITNSLLDRSNEPLDHPWFCSGEPPVILSVGRLTAQKNFSGLIEAFSQVRKSVSARLLILGEGELRADLEELVERLNLKDEVSLPGFVNNPYKYMKQAAVYALSSSWEGLPTVLIEALAVELPVVATNCKSGPYEILRGGKLGKLVPVGDIPELADGIAECLSDKKSFVTMDALEPFTQEWAVKEYLSVARGGL